MAAAIGWGLHTRSLLYGFLAGFRAPLPAANKQPLEVDDEILRFVALQLRMDPGIIQTYADRRQTVSEHQQQIRGYLFLRSFDAEVGDRMAQFLEGEAQRLDRIASLMVQARTWFRDERILAPADDLLRRSVGSARQRAREKFWQNGWRNIGHPQCVPNSTRFSTLARMKLSRR